MYFIYVLRSTPKVKILCCIYTTLLSWLRGKDSNLRLPGYEPGGLPLTYPAIKVRVFILAVLGGNDPHSYGVTSHRASMNTLRPKSLYENTLGCLTEITVLNLPYHAVHGLVCQTHYIPTLSSAILQYPPCGFVSIFHVTWKSLCGHRLVSCQITYWVGNPMCLHIVPGLDPGTIQT